MTRRIDKIKDLTKDVPQIRKIVAKATAERNHEMASNIAALCLHILTQVYTTAQEEDTEHDWQEVRRRDD